MIMIHHCKKIVIAAPQSHSGKTSITLGLIAALSRQHYKITALKNGPDYIDTGFFKYAGAENTYNYDVWAMRDTTRQHIIYQGQESDIIIGEGSMGLFDKPSSTAMMAKSLSANVILVVNCRSIADSIAALVKGYVEFDKHITVIGVILNQVMSEKHEKILRYAMKESLPYIHIIGCIPYDDDVHIPSRYLGLQQAHEDINIKAKINLLADYIIQYCDIDLLLSLMSIHQPISKPAKNKMIMPLLAKGGKIAIAYDICFAFIYQHIINNWRDHDIDIVFFSPLADESPDADSDAIYLPGGYPELYAQQLSYNKKFITAMRHHAKQGKKIYGECGGYMVLGNMLTDKDNIAHKMIGLLPINSHINAPKRVLGYRQILSFGFLQNHYRGHEFHYATAEYLCDDKDFFCQSGDYNGQNVGYHGIQHHHIAGSFMHIIDLQDS